MNRLGDSRILLIGWILSTAFVVGKVQGQERAECLAKFEMDAPGGRLLAVVTVAGCSFLMEADSGAVCTFFDRRLAELLGPEVSFPEELPLPATARDLKWFRPEKVTIGTTTFSPRYAAITDLTSRCLAGDAPVLGVLGADFFSSFAIEVDNDACEWAVYSPKGLVARWKDAHKLVVERVNDNMPFVEVWIAGERIRVLLDTGGGMSVRLAPDSFEKVKPRVAARYHPQGYSTANAESLGAYLADCAVNVGPFEHKRIIVAQGSRSRQPSMVGRFFLARYNMLCDFGAGQLLLEKSERHDSRDNSDMDGVTFTATGNAYLVTTVRTGSMAHRAGLRPGDSVVSIDAKQIRGSDVFFGYMAVPRTCSVALEVVRGRERLEVVLPP